MKRCVAELKGWYKMRLIDADKFLKEILTAGLGKTIIEYSESNIGYMIRKQPTVDAADVLRGQWISVKDRLPEGDEKCIFFASGNNAAHIGQYVYSGRDGAVKFKKRDGRGTVLYTASHWMPLPKPPEK